MPVGRRAAVAESEERGCVRPLEEDLREEAFRLLWRLSEEETSLQALNRENLSLTNPGRSS